MKVSELIEHLSSLDQDLPVFVNGYEGGCHELERNPLRVAWVFPDRYLDDEWYFGPHLESPTGAEGAAESAVIDRPGWPQSLYSPTETTTAGGWGGGTRHAASTKRD